MGFQKTLKSKFMFKKTVEHSQVHAILLEGEKPINVQLKFNSIKIAEKNSLNIYYYKALKNVKIMKGTRLNYKQFY